MSWLELKQISLGYTNKVILEQANVCFSKGTSVALIGKNGVGKSTLLRTLAGLQKPISGQVLLEGKSIHNYNALQIARTLSVVLTDSLPPSNLTVYELVALGRYPYTNWKGTLQPQDVQMVEKALSITQTDALKTQKHHQLSDGQLQRVLIARAIAQDTPIILLDEPTNHLDIEHKIALHKLLNNIAKTEQKLIIYATHDLEWALQICHEVLVLKPNQLLKGTFEELVNQNVFEHLFDRQVTFDPHKLQFKVM